MKDTAFYRPQPDPPNGSLYTHVASPEIYIDQEQKKIILWAHGMWTDGKAWLGASDGQHFTSRPAITKHSYLRVFKDRDTFYGVARGGRLFRSKDPFAEFEPGADLFRNTRSCAGSIIALRSAVPPW